MIKKIFTLSIIFGSLGFILSSCLDDDKNEIDEEWKTMNEEAFSRYLINTDYSRIWALSKDDEICWKDETIISEKYPEWKPSGNVAPNYSPLFTDSVQCRYEGWYFTKNGEKVVFDSTEKNNGVPRSFLVSGVIEGWRTALQYMKEGDEKEIVIPWVLGYGASGSSAIPAYTTLWFNMKLLKITPMKGKNQ